MKADYHVVGPARAGMIRSPPAAGLEPASWPRTSGDDPRVPANDAEGERLAPHERG